MGFSVITQRAPGPRHYARHKMESDASYNDTENFRGSDRCQIRRTGSYTSSPLILAAWGPVCFTI